uniref:protein-L-isoaspartate(D-aspartate) O-methyltransferase n=1 Tax=Wuchereria bancrofti TaxID=6293 RepID=A0AAF5PTG6_WUCBA
MSFPQNTSNAVLVDFLKKVGHIKDDRVIRIKIAPQQIGYNATISAPHMHALALALELLNGHLRDGTWYCILAPVGRRGRVIGIDHIKELVDLSISNINKHHSDLFMDVRITMVTGDGRSGYRASAAYIAIHVGAAAPKLPDILVDQLAPGGWMIIPIGKVFSDRHFVQVDKDLNGNVEIEELFDVLFVPLTDRKYQLGHLN